MVKKGTPILSSEDEVDNLDVIRLQREKLRKVKLNKSKSRKVFSSDENSYNRYNIQVVKNFSDPRLYAVKRESNIRSEVQYTPFLNFRNKNDEIDYREWLKSEIKAGTFWIFCFLVAGIDINRIIMAYYVNKGGLFTAALSVMCFGSSTFYIYLFTHYDELVTLYIRQFYPANSLKAFAKSIGEYIDAENLLGLTVTTTATLFLIARVLAGKCSNNDSYDSFVAANGCNPNIDAFEPPTSNILVLYLYPLVMQICVKGVSKNILFSCWFIGSAAVAYGILTLRGYLHFWDILHSLIVLLTLYETERLKISSFLQNKYALIYETKKREIAEKEYAVREQELQKIETTKDDFEAIAQKREVVLRKLPLHRAIIDRVEVDTLLSLIAEYIDTAKLLDYDGNTAFTLILDYHDADVRAVTQLLMNSLPVDPMTQLPVDESKHLYAWTRAVQYEKYEKAIVFVLSLYPSIAQQLSVAEDKEGRQVVHIASPKCKRAIMRYLLFFQRYEILTLDQPHYKTDTSIVHLAVDHESIEDDKMVAMKFMRQRTQFLREVRVRVLGNFSEEHVMGSVRVHDCDEDPDFKDEAITKGFERFPYCFVMHVGDRNLGDVMIKEHIAGRDWSQITMITTQIAAAVGHMHQNGFIHGDLKPLNIMRVGQQMKLIDLDASVSFTSGTEFSGVKFSSGYLCPELIYCTPTVVCVKTKSVEFADKNSPHLFDLVKASKAHDLWSLGVVIYNIATNAPLFLCDGDGNIDDTDLRLLAEWPDSVKLEKLLKVKNIMARNLISLLLSKDPNKRPSVQHVMVHPFLTGKRVSKAVGEVAQFDVFLSYRIDSDLHHVELLYKMLTEAGVSVWWDKMCLKSGESGDVGFCFGLMRSKVFMPIISQKAIGRFSDLTRDSPCDNLLLEFILALEFKERGCIDKIFPIFIGEKNEFTDEYCKYSFTGVNPDHPQNLPNISVDCVEAKLMVRIDDIGLGLPFTEAIAVDNTVAAILKYQGNFVEGELVESFQAIISHALPMFSNNRGVMQSLLEGD